MNWFLHLPNGLPSIAVLTVAAVIALLFVHLLPRRAVRALAALGPIAAAIPLLLAPGPDTFAIGAVLATTVIAALLLGLDALELEDHCAECAALLLLGSAGAIALAAAPDLLSLLVGLETLSMSIAILTGLGRGDRPLGAAFRFFVLAAVSVATMIYGIGLVAFATGSFAIGAPIVDAESTQELHFAGLVLVTLGIGFELALVPMHFGALAAYRNAPMAFAGFAMTASKLAAALVLARLVSAYPQLQPLLLALGMLSIVVGTLGGLAQRDLRGLLAWSAVGHGGFLALAIGCGSTGRDAAMFYAVTYIAAATLAAAAIAGSGAEEDGSNASRPRGIASTAALLSLAGVPPSPGFWAKLAVLVPAWRVAGPVLTSLALLAAVFGALFYLRPVPGLIAGGRAREGGTTAEASAGRNLALLLTGAVWLLFTVLPELAIRLTR